MNLLAILIHTICFIIPPLVGEAGFSSARLRTSVRVCVCNVTTLQRRGWISAVQSLLLAFQSAVARVFVSAFFFKLFMSIFIRQKQ